MADRYDVAADDLRSALAAWRKYDAQHALHHDDHRAIDASEPLRALVLDLLARPGSGRDLYNACARLGRLHADAGASPSLAVATLDGAARALADLGLTVDPNLLARARASVAEGYVAVIVERERLATRRTWEYPACAVRVAKDTVALVAGYPADDGEALADWAARVATSASRDRYKQAILAGSDEAKAELVQALSLVGIVVADGVERKGWLTSLLKR